MTALDQALIKAFSQQVVLPPAVSPQPATPVSKAKQEVDSGQSAVVSDRKADGRNATSKIQHLTPNIVPPFPTGPAPSLATPDGVWAALERSPNATVDLLKAEGRGRKAEEEFGTGRPADGSGEWMAPVPIPESRISSPEFQAPSLEVQAHGSDVPLAARELKPAWQVDHFTWPRLCRRLISQATEQLDRLTDALLAANVAGQKVLAIGGWRRGEGATTLLLCAAHRLAERGIRAVLVDADFGRPRLAKRLGVQPQLGWDETTAQGDDALDQVLVVAAANNVALLPIREPSFDSDRPAGKASRLHACLDILRNHYDMVLVDLGPLADVGLADGAASRVDAGMIDAAVLVHDGRITSEGQLAAVAGHFAAAGIAVAGIVENFVAEE
jgi:Mrp family chromosome partitioning ATPase